MKGVSLKKINIVVSIISFLFLVITFTTITLTLTNNQKENKHIYIEGTVTDKTYTEGYGSIYYYVEPDFMIVAKYEYNNKTYTYTHHVSDTIYNSYNINDKIVFCFEHEKLKEYENNSKK